MKLTRYITHANTISLSHIMDFSKVYEAKAAPGVIRIVSLNAAKGMRSFDALLTPTRQYTVRLPNSLMERAGFLPEQNVYIFKKDSVYYLLDPAYKGIAIKAVEAASVKMPEFLPQRREIFAHAAAAEYTPMKLERYYLKSRALRSLIGMDSHEKDVQCSIFHDGAHTWMEVRKAAPDALGAGDVFTREELDERFRAPMQPELNGLSYFDKICTIGLLVPEVFRTATGIQRGATLPVWSDGDCVVIEGPVKTCAACGSVIRTTTEHPPIKVNTCQDCLHEMGPNGMVSAIIQAEKALDKAAPFLCE